MLRGWEVGGAFSSLIVAVTKRVLVQRFSKRHNTTTVISVPATSEVDVMVIIVFSMRSASYSTGVCR